MLSATTNPLGRKAAIPAILVLLGISFSTSFATVGFAGTGQFSQGGDALKQLSLEALGDIEVTTISKEPETVRRTPAAVFVLTDEDIRRSGSTSLPEVLRLVPGVQVARLDSDHWAVGVRGFANQFSQSLLVLIDGRSVYTPLFAGVYWSVQDTLLEDIERIEVIRGPGATIWGANAVNGVINIITKRVGDTQGISASAGGGNVDHAVAGFRYGGTRGDSLDYRVYAKGFERGPQFHSNGPDFDGWRTAQGGFRADWTGRRDVVTVEGDIYKGRHGQSVSLGTYSPPSQAITYDPVDLSGGNLLAQWRRNLGNGNDIRFQTYYDRTYLLGPQVGESRHTFDVDFINQVAGLPRNSVIWGLGARVSPSEIIQTIPTLDITPHDRTNSIYSVFAQDEITLVDKRLWLTVGSKVEHNSYTGIEVQPSVRTLWALTDTQTVWGGVTRAVRTPSRLEADFQYTGMLAAKPPTFVRIVGNEDFASERLLGFEAGYRSALTPQFYLDVAVFHNDHDNLQSLGSLSTVVETTPAPAHLLYVFPYANGVEGVSDGFEVTPDWRPARAWKVKGSYSYLHIDLRNKPGNTDTGAVATYEGSTPRHQAMIRSLITLPKGWQLDQTMRYASALPAQHVDAYLAADVRVGWQLGRRFEVSLTGQNLTRAHHVEFSHSPPPAVAIRRSVVATMTWKQ